MSQGEPRAGWLSDPNVDPAYLATLVPITYNKKAYAPSMKAIKDKYYELFRGHTEQAAGSSSDAAGPSTPK